MFENIFAAIIAVLLVALWLTPILADGQGNGFKAYLQALGCVFVGVVVLLLLGVFGATFAYLLQSKY